MSKLKIENNGMLLVSVFYIIAGIISLIVLPLALYPPHFAIIGVFSLVAAYGLFRKRSWALYPVIILFLMATVLSIYTLYFFFMEDIITSLSMIAYLILSWIATIYAVAKRTKLES